MIKVIFSTTGGIGSRLLRVMMASPYIAVEAVNYSANVYAYDDAAAPD